MSDKAREASYEDLATARKAFNEYFEASVKPLLGLSDRELERLNFTQTATRIPDADIREEYRDRASRLLDTNILYYAHNASPIRTAERNTAFHVASTLLVSALAYRYASGIFSALVAAAIWYWLVAEYESRRKKEVESAATEHNAEVAEWTKTIEDWRADRTTLELVN